MRRGNAEDSRTRLKEKSRICDLGSYQSKVKAEVMLRLQTIKWFNASFLDLVLVTTKKRPMRCQA